MSRRHSDVRPAEKSGGNKRKESDRDRERERERGMKIARKIKESCVIAILDFFDSAGKKRANEAKEKGKRKEEEIS